MHDTPRCRKPFPNSIHDSWDDDSTDSAMSLGRQHSVHHATTTVSRLQRTKKKIHHSHPLDQDPDSPLNKIRYQSYTKTAACPISTLSPRLQSADRSFPSLPHLPYHPSASTHPLNRSSPPVHPTRPPQPKHLALPPPQLSVTRKSVNPLWIKHTLPAHRSSFSSPPPPSKHKKPRPIVSHHSRTTLFLLMHFPRAPKVVGITIMSRCWPDFSRG